MSECARRADEGKLDRIAVVATGFAERSSRSVSIDSRLGRVWGCTATASVWGAASSSTVSQSVWPMTMRTNSPV